jgi:hypothetical protein
MLQHLALPPFGKILKAYQDENIRLKDQIYIHIGKDCKQFAQADINVGSLASYALPEYFHSYEWPIYSRLIVLMDHGDSTAADIKKISFHLLNFHPQLIYVWSTQHGCHFFKGESI